MDASRRNGMNERQKRLTAAFALWGGVIITALLLVTTVWVLGSARTGTAQAVSRVSEFYLEELAGRRARMVSEQLRSNVTNMENALTVLEASDLVSQDALRRYLGKMKRLYGVDKFALVDENGVVYAEHSTTSGLSRYPFLARELTEPVLVMSNLYGAKKQVIQAVPVEGVYFRGVRMRACFIQVNVSEMLEAFA